MERLRIGIVGCGRVVQTVHLAALANLPDIGVTAVCDADAGVLDHVAGRLGVAARFTDATDLASCPDVDAVLVATRDHVGPALAAIQSGKHVLIEKPLCFDPATAAAIDRAAQDANVVAMIGYMKRYDWCFERFCEIAARLPGVRFSRAHDFACRFDKSDGLFVTFPPSRAVAGAGIPRTLTERLLTFASHDFAVVRAAVGEPEEVTFAEAVGPTTLVVALNCRDRRPCTMELSLDTRYEWFDETLTIYGDESVIGIRFADPFIPFARSALWMQRTDDDGADTQITTGPFEDAFRREWRHFASCIRHGFPPRTPLTEGVADAQLAAEIASRLSWSEPDREEAA